ncbi:MAG: hypothetical protein K2G18_07620 [Bacteroidales bacterium]|nr:hypothetical protein [Bacteroidales bacterium]
MRNIIIVSLFASFVFVSCGMTCADGRRFYMQISPGDSSCECVYDATISSRYKWGEEQGKPIVITRDTVLCCYIGFFLPSSVGKDKITGKTRYVTFRRLSGEGECDIYMLTNDTVKYKGEEYAVGNLVYNVIWNNDTSLMTKEELNELVKGASSKFSLPAGEDIITVPITYTW